MAFSDAWTVVDQCGKELSGGGTITDNLRVLIETAHIKASGSTIRMTLHAGDSVNLVLSSVYIGIQASSGDAYDFASTPTEITFDSGGHGCTVLVNGTKLSDEIAFNFSDANSYIVSFYFLGGNMKESLVLSDAVQCWYKDTGTNEGAIVDVSSYNLLATYFCNVSKIEVQAAGGYVDVPYPTTPDQIAGPKIFVNY